MTGPEYRQDDRRDDGCCPRCRQPLTALTVGARGYCDTHGWQWADWRTDNRDPGDENRRGGRTMTGPDYWTMTDADLADAWRTVDADNLATDYDGTVAERLAFIEDAILQRIGAPDDADPDVPAWQTRIRSFGAANLTPGVMTGEENDR